jgi:hypothetical protein
MKIACLITGIPREGTYRCMRSLKFLLSEHKVDFFTICRNEFKNCADFERIWEILPIRQSIIIDKSELDNTAATVNWMWHELYLGHKSLESQLEQYDLIFRTRFDVYFPQIYFPIISPSHDEVYLPDQFNWSGSNDMLCAASPRTFKNYASTYTKFKSPTSLINKNKIAVPEQIMSASLHENDLREKKLDINFVLYRSALFDNFDNGAIDALCFTNPYLSIYKVGSSDDTAEKRLKVTHHIQNITRNEKLYPLKTYEQDGNVYAPEIDVRDNTIFRFMSLHMQIYKAIPSNTTKVSFMIHYMVPETFKKLKKGDQIIHILTMLIDNEPINLYVHKIDEFGRILVQGIIHSIKFGRPMSKIGISCLGAKVPSEINPASRDNRCISIALGNINFG